MSNYNVLLSKIERFWNSICYVFNKLLAIHLQISLFCTHTHTLHSILKLTLLGTRLTWLEYKHNYSSTIVIIRKSGGRKLNCMNQHTKMLSEPFPGLTRITFSQVGLCNWTFSTRFTDNYCWRTVGVDFILVVFTWIYAAWWSRSKNFLNPHLLSLSVCHSFWL